MTTAKKLKFSWGVLIGFMALIALLWVGLSLDPRFLPSKMIEKQFPSFSLPNLTENGKMVHESDLNGHVALVHIWATWCGICLREHADLLTISKKWPYPIYSILYQDNEEGAKNWLHSKGNPYAISILDSRGRLGLDLGVYGTPETFVIDEHGTIRYRLVGPMTVGRFEREVLPILKDLTAVKPS